MGLYLIINILKQLPYLITFYWETKNNPGWPSSTLTANIAGFTFVIVFGWLLMRCAAKIATWVFKEEAKIELPFQSRDLQIVILSCIGVFLSVTALIELVGHFIIVSELHADNSLSPRIIASSAAFAKLFLGILLSLQSTKLTNFLEKANSHNKERELS
ncbi:MAG: hypothetical protein HRT88_01215 [Lentisphaeraceae bacterium]|nr:hypothetical protein [Lentisphaeraceae bacterium]